MEPASAFKLVFSSAKVSEFINSFPLLRFTSEFMIFPLMVVASSPRMVKLKCSCPIMFPSISALFNETSPFVSVTVMAFVLPVRRVLLIFKVVFAPISKPSLPARLIVERSSFSFEPLIVKVPAAVCPISVDKL